MSMYRQLASKLTSFLAFCLPDLHCNLGLESCKKLHTAQILARASAQSHSWIAAGYRDIDRACPDVISSWCMTLPFKVNGMQM